MIQYLSKYTKTIIWQQNNNTADNWYLKRGWGNSFYKIWSFALDGTIYSSALGGKINGSDGGGCMFAYSPKDPEKMAVAIERVGGKAYVIHPDVGTRIERFE